jgi:toxin ParE1/3/4
VADKPPLQLLVSGPAKRDIAAILNWSLREFGEDAAARYNALIRQALLDIRANPERPGAQYRKELAEGVVVYHLRHSRDRPRTRLGTVSNPRHFVIYRLRGQTVEILRLLHDARDLQRHLPPPDTPELT